MNLLEESSLRFAFGWHACFDLPAIWQVTIFTISKAHSTCKGRFRLQSELTKRAVKLKFRFLSNNFRLGPKSPRYNNGSFDLQGEISTSTGTYKTCGKAEVSVFEEQLPIWPEITEVHFLQLAMAHSICKGRFRLPPELTKGTVKLKSRLFRNNFRLGPKSPRYSFYT